MLRTRKGRALRVLFIIDEYTKRIVASYMAPSIKQEDVARVLLEAMIRERVQPENIRSDNGSEFIAETVQEFMAANGIKAITIDPGCPWQNGVNESFNACARRELLDREQFYTLSEARVVISGWIDDYNTHRPHGALGCLTPDELMGAEPALWPVGLTQEPSNTLPEATQL
jgi:transposase InsO family protein